MGAQLVVAVSVVRRGLVLCRHQCVLVYPVVASGIEAICYIDPGGLRLRTHCDSPTVHPVKASIPEPGIIRSGQWNIAVLQLAPSLIEAGLYTEIQCDCSPRAKERMVPAGLARFGPLLASQIQHGIA